MKNKPLAIFVLFYALVLVLVAPTIIIYCTAYDRKNLGLIIGGMLLTASSLFVLKKYKKCGIPFDPTLIHLHAENRLLIVASMMTLFGLGLVTVGIYGWN